jgi:hypothetical protein
MIVDVVRVGVEVAVVAVILQKRIDAGRGMIGAKSKHVEGMYPSCEHRCVDGVR